MVQLWNIKQVHFLLPKVVELTQRADLHIQQRQN